MLISKIYKFFSGEIPFDAEHNIVLTGLPRSGTTLSCFLLSQVENVVALNEPISFGKCRSRKTIVNRTKEHYTRTRGELIKNGKTVARVGEKGMVTNHFLNEKDKGKRKKIIRKRELAIDKNLDDDFTLIIKHNAAFTVVLDDLIKEMKCFAIVRNPMAVLGSWNSVDIPVSRGNIRKNLAEIAKGLHLSQAMTVFERQLAIMDFYFRSYDQLKESQVIRYEDIIKSSGVALNPMVPHGKMEPYSLESKNLSKSYDKEKLFQLGKMLLDSENGCWSYYSKEEVEDYLTKLSS